MYLLGHTDPTLTMRVYHQVLDMGGAAVEHLEEVLGCTIHEAFMAYSGRESLGTQWAPATEIASQDCSQHDRRNHLRLFRARSKEAADGIRTHDLLHGKQTL